MRNAVPDDAPAGESRPDLAPWSGAEMLLAAVLDAVRMNTQVLVAANGGKPGEFKPTPRPGVSPEKSSGPRRLTDEERRALDPRLRNQTQQEA